MGGVRPGVVCPAGGGGDPAGVVRVDINHELVIVKMP